MKKPKMILFDFGETLITEIFTPMDGTKAVMDVAVKIPEGVTCEDVQRLADELNADACDCSKCGNKNIIETHYFYFNRYLYEYFGIEFNKTPLEMERIFFNASIVSKAVPYIQELLDFLHAEDIRTAVISNISYSADTLNAWIKRDLPGNRFEFVIASSEYLFRKPSPRIFDIALRKAGLNASDVWFCGNNLYFDVNGAHLSGLHPIWYKGARWFTDGGADNIEHTVITDWREMIDLIRNFPT